MPREQVNPPQASSGRTTNPALSPQTPKGKNVMTQQVITDRADAIIAQLAEITGENEFTVSELMREERRRLASLARRPDRLEIAERVHLWFSTARNELEPIRRRGILEWSNAHSPAKVWATLHGLKRDGIRSVSL
jgi:hypothetical protein